MLARRLIAAALLVLGARPLHAEPTESDEQLFARVFKQAPVATQAPVAVLLDAMPTGEIVMLDLRAADPYVPSAVVRTLLVSRLRPNAQTALLAATQGATVSLAALRALGLQVAIDARALELRLGVPAALTSQASHDLGASAPPDAADALRPADISGYVNLRIQGAGRWSDASGSSPATAQLVSDGAINVHRWVLEGSATLSAGDGQTVTARRGDILVSNDSPESALRFLAGDFAVAATGLQDSYPIAGIALVRNFALQPYRVVRPVGAFDFVLERPAHVTVVVNGTAVQTMDLPAGRHDVRDLPLGAGVNEVVLEIRDDAGFERRLAFSFANRDELLAPGLAQFAFAVGFPQLDATGLHAYDFRTPIASARRRWGWTANLTAGLSMDASIARQVVGVAAATATRVGNLTAELAASREDDVGFGGAVGARYDLARTTRSGIRSLALTGHLYSSGYRSFAVVPRAYDGDLALAASWPIQRTMAARFDARYQLGRDERDAIDTSAGLAWSFGSFAIDARVGARRDARGTDELRAFVTTQWTPHDRRSRVRTISRGSSARGVTNQATVATSSRSGAGRTAATVGISQAPGSVGTDGTLSYTGDRFTAAAAASTGTGGLGRAASFELGTALAFAAGQVAWSRPISGSFAIVDRHEAIDDVVVRVDPTPQGYAAKSDRFGDAVVAGLEPYRVNRVTFDAPALPLGSSLGSPTRSLLPSYKSGTLVHVGEAGSVFVRGVLRDDRAPLAFATMELRSVDDPTRPAIVTMSNRIGRFSAPGLQAGRYEIRVAGAPARIGALVVPATAVDVHAVGDVVVR